MIKAAAGGGGRGIRVVARRGRSCARRSPQARAEAEAAFGDGAVYLERFVDRARHVEVQVLGDGTDAVHLVRARMLAAAPPPEGRGGGRPRRRCPAPVREHMRSGRGAAGRRGRLRGAGTVEYLYDDARGDFYFIEMNTRIQVEHPVTEMITGIDLVREKLRIAGGEPLPFRQDDVEPRGHAIECRINAEDPALDFLPQPGHRRRR